MPHIPGDALVLAIAACVTALILFVLAMRQPGVFQMPLSLQRKEKEFALQANAGALVLILSLLLAALPVFLLYQVATKDDSAAQLKEFQHIANDLKDELNRLTAPDLRIKAQFDMTPDDLGAVEFEVERLPDRSNGNVQQPITDYKRDDADHLTVHGIKPGERIRLTAHDNQHHAWQSKAWTVPDPVLLLHSASLRQNQ